MDCFTIKTSPECTLLSHFNNVRFELLIFSKEAFQISNLVVEIKYEFNLCVH